MTTKKQDYSYHLEDGQFSCDFCKNYLIGNEGEIVSVLTDRTGDLEEVYILYVDGFHVECIGNIERSFPKSKEEHEFWKQQTIGF